MGAHPAILHLHQMGYPTAIARLVIAINIGAIYFMIIRWTPPHILEESCKITPTITNGDAAATIVFVVMIFWIYTSLPHGSPNRVLRD
jgi:hypothetical protein